MQPRAGARERNGERGAPQSPSLLVTRYSFMGPPASEVCEGGVSDGKRCTNLKTTHTFTPHRDRTPGGTREWSHPDHTHQSHHRTAAAAEATAAAPQHPSVTPLAPPRDANNGDSCDRPGVFFSFLVCTQPRVLSSLCTQASESLPYNYDTSETAQSDTSTLHTSPTSTPLTNRPLLTVH